MNYENIYTKASSVGYEDGWDDEAIQVDCPTYDLWVDAEGNISFSGAIYEDEESIPLAFGLSLGYSLIQAGLLADSSLDVSALEKIHLSNETLVVEIVNGKEIETTSTGDGYFTSKQAVKTGLYLIEHLGDE